MIYYPSRELVPFLKIIYLYEQLLFISVARIGSVLKDSVLIKIIAVLIGFHTLWNSYVGACDISTL